MNEFAQRKSDGSIWRAGFSVWGLVAAYNHATRPGKMLTERDHERSRIYARAVKNRMERIGIRLGVHYREWENGQFFPRSLDQWPNRDHLESIRPRR